MVNYVLPPAYGYLKGHIGKSVLKPLYRPMPVFDFPALYRPVLDFLMGRTRTNRNIIEKLLNPTRMNGNQEKKS